MRDLSMTNLDRARTACAAADSTWCCVFSCEYTFTYDPDGEGGGGAVRCMLRGWIRAELREVWW